MSNVKVFARQDVRPDKHDLLLRSMSTWYSYGPKTEKTVIVAPLNIEFVHNYPAAISHIRTDENKNKEEEKRPFSTATTEQKFKHSIVVYIWNLHLLICIMNRLKISVFLFLLF